MQVNEIAGKIKAAGVVGSGGAGFPTHVKFASKAEIFLVNGAECEPMLKVDQQLMAKYPRELIRGIELGMTATGAREGVICLKAKYKAAIAALEPLLPSSMRIHILKDVYPAGDEVITIWMATGRRVPPGAIPISIGVVVNNPLTLINVARAVDQDMPVITRTLTVSGAVRKPLTVTVPIGTSMAEVLAMAGGVTIDNPAYLDGGPMMGKLVNDINQPVTKTTGGLLVFPADHILIRRRTTSMEQIRRVAETNCVQCNLCTELCPRHMIGHELPPHLLVRSSNFNDVGTPLVRLAALTCSECAICEAYACPVDISPMRLNIAYKAELRAEGARYVGDLRPLDVLAEDRLIPSIRLVHRNAITRYVQDAPLIEDGWLPEKVSLPLRQHIGAAATPVVREGDYVHRGQLIAQMEEGALGASIHASMDGEVSTVTAQSITISGKKAK
ncbi:4Fe-4S dicluster domain-containing protein [Noviherbaspirillum saxi]|uniref:Electron transport complex protein RnfC n=1 Tax=Noviherbaspirillum saxi TaxID=2320863 RepID=A0A3A3G1V6_9BURK|nr:4Fe-4S dicluster domain-containing protein [Noviherbaspirillum saxi]RJF92053.1 electron transport complex protein RnfC [Noviherbaspirillum saxi]